MESAVYIALWPKNHRVLTALAGLGHRTFIAQEGLITPFVAQAIAEAGGRLHFVSEFIEPDRAAAAHAASQEMNDRVHRTFAEAPSAVGRVITQIVQRSTLQMIGLLEGLNAAAERYSFSAAVFNETDDQFSRLAARWMRRRGVPTLLIAHGSFVGGNPTVTGDILAEAVMVFGERGARYAVESGVPAHAVHITGNPAWDHYPAFRETRTAIRTRLCEELGFDPQLPIVMFGATQPLSILRFQEDGLFEETLRAFLRAISAVRASGLRLNCLVKDHPANAGIGRNTAARVAAEEGVDTYGYSDGLAEYAIVASDLLVAHDSNLFVEAMFAGLPAINLWSPSSWTMGPCFDAADGMPFVSRDEPEAFAALIATILTDRDRRNAIVAQMGSRLAAYHAPFDGLASERCATLIAQMASGRRDAGRS